MNNGSLLMVFCFIGGLAIVQTKNDSITKECVVKVATVHPDWKAEELQTACK